MNGFIVVMPSFKAGGAQRVLSILLNHMAETGADTILMLLKKEAPVEYELNKNIRIIRNNITKRNKFFNIINEIRTIRKYLKGHQGYVCVSFITMYNLYTILASLGLKNRIIVSERVAPERSLPRNSKILNRLRNLLYQKADWVVFQTREEEKYFDKIKGINRIIIPNPLSKGLPIKNDYNDGLKFISVARLETQKNYPLLMDAMDLVVDKYPEAKLLIYGKGSQEQQLLNYHMHLKHPENIIFKGFTNHVSDVMLNAYAFVLSSDYEGISNSMLEALAIGVPCICTDCPGGGAGQYIESGKTGILVPTNDKTALTNAMLKLIEDPKCRESIGRAGRYIREELDTNKIINCWMRLFA
ncbi:MAG: glycosyltransferase family 4 protein [Lachnospiraceae bacterium]|nr:glycosyltransferase family 4 protein [Lachnospiraceae bacterium]